MKIVLTGNAIWQLVAQSDKMTWLILAILLGTSVICWTIFLYKIVNWRIWRRYSKTALAHVKAADSLSDLVETVTKLTNTVPGYFLGRALNQLKQLIGVEQQQLTDQKWSYLNLTLEQLIDQIILQERSYLGFLSVAAAMAPLIGLLGTIWGLIHAFIDISMKQAADITVVAPGIAEALIATMVSLLVAIPAVGMYYYLINRVMEIEQDLVRLADYFLSVTQKLYWSGEQPKGQL